MQEVPDAEGLMAVKCATCGKTQSEATIRERERIIKLLEVKQLGCSCGCGNWMDTWELIALIKGENK
jgi:hypothetical protein